MKLSEYIDHTLLRPEARPDQIVRLCREAREYSFKSVCVNPCHTALVKKELAGSPVLTCVVIGFPLGAAATSVKVFEARTAIEDGADEIDMVINIGSLKDNNLAFVEADIRAVVEVSRGKVLVKVIIECCLLTDAEKIAACECIVRTGADYVKTSTGFSTGGATVADVALLRKTVGDKAGVKASGGIRDYATAKAMIEAGASRIGASAGIEIMKQAKEFSV
ncbi:MAG: deoxyribose-phosphate aldolase [Deltaproteobacteria bacterium]|nr:deoxyribose-phosphate aldolase [Deltaproteobacteria bacterium]